MAQVYVYYYMQDNVLGTSSLRSIVVAVDPNISIKDLPEVSKDALAKLAPPTNDVRYTLRISHWVLH